MAGQLQHLMVQYALSIVFLHTDNAKEYSVSDQILFDQFGIVHSHGVPYVSEFQGVFERCIRSVSELTRVMHVQSKLPAVFTPML